MIEQLNNNITITKEKLDNKVSNIEKLNQNLAQIDSEQIKHHFRLTQIVDSIKLLENDLKDSKKVLNDSQKALKLLKPLILHRMS